MQSAVKIEKESVTHPSKDEAAVSHSALGTRNSELFLTLWMGLSGDPESLELARRLARLNQLDELTRRRIRKELRECLDDMLGDERGAAVA